MRSFRRMSLVVLTVAGGLVTFGLAGAADASSPSMTTSQQPTSATVGTSIADKATVSGLVNPSAADSVTFNLYSSATTQNSSTRLFTDTETLSTTTSGAAACPSEDEAGFPLGTNSDSGGVLFCSYPAFAGEDPNDFFCRYNDTSGALTQDNDAGFCPGTAASVSGGGTASGSVTSASYTPTAPGTDYWVATFSGDTNNSSLTGGATAEPVTITQAMPGIDTLPQPEAATINTGIFDTAMLLGGDNPTGSVTFSLYDNSSGAGTPLFVSTSTVSGGGATSGTYEATAIGTFYWVASYTGDTNNASVSSPAGAEAVVVSKATPSITTSQQPASSNVGSTIADKATVSGGMAPSGTVTFALYDNSSGTGSPLFTDTETLSSGVATSAGYTPTATGTDYWVATYNGDADNSSVSSATDAEPVAISPAAKVTPLIATTQQPSSTTLGNSIADKATLTGGNSPTGSVTFDLYSNATATGTPLFTDTETLSSGVATSAGYTPTATGTDYWVATYNGDATNNGVASLDNDEPVVVAKATPSVATTQQPSSSTVGLSVADKATLSGGDNPTGTVTFQLYNNSAGTGTPLFTDTETLSSGSATSAGYTATATGTDYWVATYNGDANNSGVTSSAGGEPVAITKATPSVATSQQPASSTVGISIADKATVSGGDSPTGTVTFQLYNNPTATGTPLFTDTESLSGGNATSAGYVTAATGTDYWVATYNGDSDNSIVASASNVEPVVVAKATPSIATTQQPASATFGSSIADKATVSGGDSPTGTVTFKLYDNANGTGTPLFTDTETLSSGSATSAGFTPAAPGTYYWVAAYNGNANNNGVTSSNGGEPVTVMKVPTSLKASPQLVLFEPFLGVGSQVVQATLTSGGSPVSGQTIYFTDGSTQLCHANTNSKGVARCTVSPSAQALLLRTNHYTATFNGGTGYVGSTSTTLVITFFV
jgi:hypothetical protein